MEVEEAAGDWSSFLAGDAEEEGREIERRLRTGRPAGSEELLDRLERLTGRRLRPVKGGWPRGIPHKASI
jgi:hypothetical protein